MTYTKILVAFVASLLTLSIMGCVSNNQKPSSNINWESNIEANINFKNNVSLDGRDSTLNCFYFEYPNNLYVSVKDAAYLLKDTPKAFSYKIDDKAIDINTQNAQTQSLNSGKFVSEDLSKAKVKQNKTTYNNNEVKYYSILIKDLDNTYDAYMQFADFSMLINIWSDVDNDGKIILDSSKDFEISFEKLDSSRFSEDINSVLVKRLRDDKTLYQHESDQKFAIASTSKMMTYLLTMEAIKEGKLSYDDSVAFTKQAEQISKSDDGEIDIKEGQKITVSDLLKGLLIQSCNECAVTLASSISDSEAEFVKAMQEKAKPLGLKSAEFYNSSGLPVYTKSVATSKCQNKMSTNDMYSLCRYILYEYPEVVDITSLKEAKLESVDITVKSTNLFMWNSQMVDGLKSGTTNRAGNCMIVKYNHDGDDYLILLYGADNNYDKARKIELLERCIK